MKKNKNKIALYVVKQKKYLIFTIVFSLFEVLIFLATPFIYKFLIDTVFIERKTEYLIWTLLAYFVAYLLTVLFGFGKEAFKSKLSEKVTYNMRLDYYKKFKSTKFIFQEKNSIGSISTILVNEIPDFVSNYINGFTKILCNSTRIIIGIIVLGIINVKILLLLLILLPVYALLLNFLKKPISNTAVEYNKVRKDYTNNISEGVEGKADILLFEKEKWDLDRITSLFKKVIANRFKQTLLLRSAGDASYIFYWAVVILVYYFGGLAISNQTMTLGMLLVYIAYMDNVYSPSRVLLNAISSIRNANAIAKNYNNNVNQIDKNYRFIKMDDHIRLENKISINNLFFEYEKNGFNISIENLEISSGERLGLFGESGGGKSTILKILSGLYEPQSGNIFFDNKKISSSDIVNNVSVYTQYPFLFNISGNENIKFSDKQINDPKFIEYVYSSLEISDFDESRIAEISGGQYQRIALARTLIRDAKIYIFDEPTTNLDTNRRVAFSNILEKLQNMGKIIIIASHNQEEIAIANTICIVKNGRIIEIGTHKDLNKKSDSYNNLTGNNSIKQ